MSDIQSFLIWWLTVTLFGLLAWPIVFRLFRFLPDRGYTLAKTAGLLAVGYVGWILGSFGFVKVDLGGVVAAMLVVGAISLAALRGQTNALREWLRANGWVVLAGEALFLIAFGGWAIVRAYNPPIVATEKPMEFAFLNSVLRSGVQPPGDPWLAGYAISYYHFGYVIMGMLTAFSGVASGVAFNLGVALLFGLTTLGAFGVVLNLIALANNGGKARSASLLVAIFPALLGPLFILMGNLNGFLEVAYQRAWFSPEFWSWIDIKWTDKIEDPAAWRESASSGGWTPSRYLWWWQSSRVIRDRNLVGEEVEVIDEFPFFSFLLGDMHPHVLGLPFVFLAIAFGLNLFLMGQAGGEKPPPEAPANWRSFQWIWQLIPLAWPDLVAGAVILGGLSFLNTWDFPIYIFVSAAGYAVAYALRAGWTTMVGQRAVALGIGLGVLGVALYFPFYLGFRSQLGGLLPNLIFATQIQQFIVMFGPALFVILALLGWAAVKWRAQFDWQTGLSFGGSILSALILMCVALAIAILILFKDRPELQEAVGGLLGPTPVLEAPTLILGRRLLAPEYLLTPLLLTAILTGAAGLVFGLRRRSAVSEAEAETVSVEQREADRETNVEETALAGAVPILPFVMILIVTGALLTLAPEFVYLRDLFNTRMNTIFKFYYQAWVVWSLAAAFGAWLLLRFASPVGQTVFGAGLAIVAALGLIYPTLATTTITENWQGITRTAEGQPYVTLDGMAYMQTGRKQDYDAILFLNRMVKDRPVIAEAVGGSYTEFGRISAHTGLPTIIGWPFHEQQWRGTFDFFGEREGEVEKLYKTNDWATAAAILDKYNVKYVYVGPLEFGAYGGMDLRKFDQNLGKIYEAKYEDGPNDDVIIYEYKGKP